MFNLLIWCRQIFSLFLIFSYEKKSFCFFFKPIVSKAGASLHIHQTHILLTEWWLGVVTQVWFNTWQ